MFDRILLPRARAIALRQPGVGSSAPLFGLVASRYGIRVSFAAILPLPVAAIVFARYLAARDEPASAEEGLRRPGK